jgi:hypothetical protein
MRDRSERLKVFAGIVAVAFAVTLAVIVGVRLSDESLAVLAGAVCGVGAAIPTSLLIIAVTRRNGRNGSTHPQARDQYPPVVIVAPPGSQPQLPTEIPGPSIPKPRQRTFTVVGDDGDGGFREQR